MKLVGDFLSRFKNLTPPNDSIKNALVESLAEILGVSVSKNAIRLAQNTAFVSTSSVIKNTIQINRGRVLERLYEKAPKAKETIRDIR